MPKIKQKYFIMSVDFLLTISEATIPAHDKEMPLSFKHIMTTLSEEDRKKCVEFGRDMAKKIKGGQA